MALVNELEVKHVSEKKRSCWQIECEWIRDTFNINFRDGTKLNMSRIDLIEEVI